MKVTRDGVEVDIPKSQLTKEEMREYNRAAQRKVREAKADARIAEELGTDDPAAIAAARSETDAQERHQRNLAALSPEERAKLDERIADFDKYHRLSKAFSDAQWRAQMYDEMPKGVPTREMMIEEAREFERKYPPESAPPKCYFYLRTYGLFLDSFHHRILDPQPRPAPTPAPTPSAPPYQMKRDAEGNEVSGPTNAQAKSQTENSMLAAEARQIVTETPLVRFQRESRDCLAAYRAQFERSRGQQ
jgi:hypothetical protein